MGLNKRGENPDFKTLTPLYVEMQICSEYLHCSHSKFLELSKDEQIKWYLFDEMKRGRDNFFAEKRIEAMRKNKGSK